MNKIHRKLLLVFLAVLSAGFGGFVFAEIPRLISYQGKLTNASGATLDGTYSFVFRLYDGADTLKWNETQPAVQVSGGLYSVILGTTTAGITSVTFTEPFWLEIQVNGETMSPRQLVTASPYALNPSTATGENTVDYYCRQSTGVLRNQFVTVGASTVTLRTDVTALQQSTGTLKNQFAAVGASTATLRTDLDAIETQSSTVGSSTATLRADIVSLQQSTGTLKNQFVTVGASTATLRTDLSAVLGLSGSVGASTATLRTDVTALQQSTGTLKNQFVAVGASTVTLRADLDALDTQFSAVGTSTATLRADVTALQQSTGTLKNQFAGVGASTATLRTDLNAVQGQFTAVAASTATLRTDINARSQILFGSNANINDNDLPAGYMFYNNDDQYIYIATETTQNPGSWRKVSTTP